MSLLADLKSTDRKTQLEQINAFMNRRPYVEDTANWGVPDYWETPLEFLHKSGDCEDYSIAKYMSLRLLGWPAEAMRIVVLRDLKLNVPHAVLVVYLNDDAWVLDNRIRRIVRARSIDNYQPVYSLNELHWWSYGNDRSKLPAEPPVDGIWPAAAQRDGE